VSTRPDLDRDTATEAAQVLSTLASDHAALPDEAAMQLLRLIGHELAAPGVGHLRLGHLRLLIDLVIELDPHDVDSFPTAAAYTAYRAERSADGSAYPDESTLRAAYGSWLVAVQAAACFVHKGGEANVPRSRRKRFHGPYQPTAILKAILQCHEDLFGRGPVDGGLLVFPTEWEYEEWARIKRALKANPRIPGLRQIRQAFGSYDQAVRVAHGVAVQGQVARSQPRRRRGR
jgi:hypothetical protein